MALNERAIDRLSQAEERQPNVERQLATPDGEQLDVTQRRCKHIPQTAEAVGVIAWEDHHADGLSALSGGSKAAAAAASLPEYGRG